MNRPRVIYTVLLVLCLISVIIAGKACADSRTVTTASETILQESEPVRESVQEQKSVPEAVVYKEPETVVTEQQTVSVSLEKEKQQHVQSQQTETVIVEPVIVAVEETAVEETPVEKKNSEEPVSLPEPVAEEKKVTLEEIKLTGNGTMSESADEVRQQITEAVMPEPAPEPETADVPEPEKIRVHRTGSSVIHFDLGAVFIAKGHETKKFGAFLAAAVTPVPVWRFLAGVKLAGGISAGTEILRGDPDRSRRSMLNGFAEAMLLLKYPIAKSFEVYAGPGAEFQCFDFESLSNFSQAWGVVAQLGCRGRTSDHFGVGVDATVHYLITKGLDFGPLLIDLRAYISAEI